VPEVRRLAPPSRNGKNFKMAQIATTHAQVHELVDDDPVLTEHAEEIRRLSKRVVADIIEIGRRLKHAHDLLRRGRWLTWLEREFGWAHDTATRYIDLFEFSQQEFELRKLRNLDDLPVSALYLLSKASCPPGARAEIGDRVDRGERLSVAKVSHVISRHKKPNNVVVLVPPVTKPESLPSIAATPSGLLFALTYLCTRLEPRPDPSAFAEDIVTLGKDQIVTSGRLRNAGALLSELAQALDGRASLPPAAANVRAAP
jgi:hypothetical protein